MPGLIVIDLTAMGPDLRAEKEYVSPMVGLNTRKTLDTLLVLSFVLAEQLGRVLLYFFSVDETVVRITEEHDVFKLVAQLLRQSLLAPRSSG